MTVEAWQWRQALLLLVAFAIPLGQAAVGAAVLLVLAIGELFAGEPVWTPTPLDGGLVGFTLVAVVSAGFSPWRHLALTSALLFGASAFVVVRAITLASHRTPAFGAWFLGAWGFGGVVAAIAAIATFGPGADARAGLPGLGYNALGTLLAVSLMILLGLSSAGPRTQRVLGLLGVPLVAAGLVLTFSRGAWLAAGLGLGALAWAGGFRRLLAGALVVVLIAGVSIPVLAPRWRWHAARLADLAPREGPSSRTAVWRLVPAIVAAHPLVGTGLGTFPFAYARLSGRDPSDHPMPFAHNILLNVAAETGLAGLAAFLAFLVAGLWAAYRWQVREARDRRDDGAPGATTLAALTALLGQQMVDATIMGVHIAIALFALLSLAAAGDHAGRRRPPAPGGVS